MVPCFIKLGSVSSIGTPYTVRHCCCDIAVQLYHFGASKFSYLYPHAYLETKLLALIFYHSDDTKIKTHGSKSRGQNV